MAWAYVKSANNIPAPGAGTTVAKAYGSAVTATNLLTASCTWGVGSGAASFSDSVNGSWTATVKSTNDATNNQSVSTSFFASTASGTPTVTATFASADSRGIIISEYSGVATSTPEDGTAVGDVKAAGTTQTSSNITVSQSGDLIYGFIVEDSTGTATITSTDVTQHDGTGGQAPTIVNAVDIGAGDKTGPASGTVSVTFTFSLSKAAIVQARAFKAAAAGGAANAMLLMPGNLAGGGELGAVLGNFQ